MLTSRLMTSLLLRASRSTVPKFAARQFRARPSLNHRVPPAAIRIPHLRFYSQEPKPITAYNFDDIKTLSSTRTSTFLIDAREPSELQSTGTIPTSINIPITSQPDAFFISDEEFQDRFGFERPWKDQEVVFFCKAGVRSKAAAELARQAGWENVGEYRGSWLDWEKNGGEKESVK